MKSGVLALVPLSVKLMGTMLPDFSVVCAAMLIDEMMQRSERILFNMIAICDYFEFI